MSELVVSTNAVTLFDNRRLMRLMATYLTKKKNIATRREYLREMNRYIRFLTNHTKELVLSVSDNWQLTSSITEEDLIIDQNDAEDYQQFLRDELLMSSATTYKSISVIRRLYAHLAANNIQVKSEWFSGLEKLGKETVEYASFTYEQAVQAMAIVAPTEKGDMKEAMIETAIHTGFRLNEILQIQIEFITLFEGKTWTIKIPRPNAKRNKENIKPIPEQLYNKLMALRKNYNLPDGYVFKLQKNTVNKMMKLIRQKLDLEVAEGEEPYVFHSFKKCAVYETYLATKGDIKEMQEMGNHADPTMALGTYTKLEKRRKIHLSPSLRFGQKANIIPIMEKMTKEQIIEVIGKCSQYVHIEIENLLK